MSLKWGQSTEAESILNARRWHEEGRNSQASWV